MGLAASQARFLGLTARKSNTEYEGQQVNQQRTALANESAGLFNEMMALKVPSAPSTALDYSSTSFTPTSAYQVDFQNLSQSIGNSDGIFSVSSFMGGNGSYTSPSGFTVAYDGTDTEYDVAMRLYEAHKEEYDRKIAEINAKTDAIQEQDKTLELKLKQLDSDQQAIQTELDAVKKVIDKNIDMTFKTFA